MKFKKSISFALTLCMVLSLFATFVIPASAAEKAVTATVTDGSVKILTEKLALLCDGNDAASATAFSDAGLVAFENTGFTHTDGVDAAVPATIEFVLDLGEATGISGAYMTFFRDDASMVALPSGVVFEGSVDGKYWYNLNAGGTVAPSADDKTVATAKADFSTRAVYEVRYVKATATFKNGWIFAGELGVLAAGNSGVGAIAPDYAFAYTADSTPSSNCIGIFGAGTYDLATSEEGKYLKSGQLLIAKEVADGVYVTSMNKVNAWPDGHSGEVTIAEDEILVSIVTGGALANNETDYYTTAKWIARGLPNEGTVIVVDKEASTVAFYPANYEVPVELPEGAVEIEYLGYIHAAHSMVAYAEADMTLGALVNKYLGAVKDLNYCKVAICDEDGTVTAVYLTLGREPAEGPNGIKTDLTIAAGQFAVIYNANKAGHEVMDAINVGDTITLYNVGALKTHTGTAVALENAGFTVEAAPAAPEAGADLSETLSLWGSGDDISVLTNGKTGVGEIVSWESGVGELFGIANSVTAEAKYSFTVVFEETEFNTVTVYALDFVNGFVPLPGSVVIVVDGVEYETVVTPNPNGIATYVADLGEAVTASYVTVKAVMAESTLGGATFNMFSEVAVSTVVEDDESYKDTHTYVDGVNVGTIQQLGADWEGKPASDFWYLVDSGKETVTVSVVVDDRAIVADDTMLRVWIDADMSDKTRTTLVDVKVKDGEAYIARIDGGFDAAVKSVTYEAVGKDYKLVLVLDKATLGITGEYGLNVQLGQTGSTTMHSIKYDNVTGEGATYAPWTTTEFYEIFDKAPTTSQVVENFNHADWNTGVNTFHAAYIFTDAEIYAGVGMAWWYHAAFAPTANGAYVVTEIAAPGSDAATKNTLTIPEGGFIWVAWTSAEAGNGKDSGAYAKGVMSGLKVGDLVLFNGLDIANLTTAEDASATVLAPAADMDLIVSHNYNYSWHCFETQIITMAVGEAGLKKAGDAPNMSAEDTDILYIVELVDGAYLVTGVVGGKALLDVEIPENGFLYYVTKNCTGYDKICHGELIGKYLVLGDIDLATKFAIDTSKDSGYTMKAVSGFKTGDADLDGKITATDYAIVRKLVLGTLTAEDVGELAYKAADVNGNGKVDARDYYLVKRAFLVTYVIPGWEQDDAE